MTISDVAKEIIGRNLPGRRECNDLKSIEEVSPLEKQNWGMIKEHSYGLAIDPHSVSQAGF